MKSLFPVLMVAAMILSCNNSSVDNTVVPVTDTPVKQSFFPVTSFLKGEIYMIKERGINPLKYTTINNHTDSVWLKIEALDSAVSEFLHPEIDTANLAHLFIEKSFLDQSIDAVTFTYEPVATLPDTMPLKEWFVYLDPSTSNVKRVYMVKEISKTKTLQLTWVSKQWCKITSIVTDQNGVSTVEKEEKLFWGF